MKKIITALAIIAIIVLGGFVFWKYFNINYQEYEKFAEIEVAENDRFYFLDEMVVKISDENIGIYKVTEDYFGEIYNKASNEPEVIFTSADYFVIRDGNDYNVYYEKDGQLTATLLPSQRIRSIHQFADTLCIKMIDNKGKTTIYSINKFELPKNVSVDFDFVDYCIDPVSKKEYFISYELSGEFVKLVIRNEKVDEYKTIDNFVYNDLDCIGDMIVFYTDDSMVFVNMKTGVIRTQNYYNIDNLKKFIFNTKIIYYSEDAFFNGINNLLIVQNDISSGKNLDCSVGLGKFGDKLIYLDNNSVKLYQGSESILDDNILFMVDGAQDVHAMKNVVAVTKDKKIEFMKVIK